MLEVQYLSFPQALDLWGNDRSLKSALYESLFIRVYMIVGIVFTDACIFWQCM
jgi:hypothetical protein